MDILFKNCLFTAVLFLSSYIHANEGCITLFNQNKSIVDLDSFAGAMTRGMLLNEEQSELFEIYRKIYFGDALTDVEGKSLKNVFEIIKKYPDLKKEHFPEKNISIVKKAYPVPIALHKFIQSHIVSSAQVRTSLFQVEANQGYWRKLIEIEIDNFPKFINKLINHKMRIFLLNPKIEYREKVIALFRFLDQIRLMLEKKGAPTQNIRQAMVDLVHTSGYMNQSNLALLKSSNALDKIEGFRKILDERDSMAMLLGFEGHFISLMQSLRVDFPTGTTKGEDISLILNRFEKEILSGPYTVLPSESVRVRSLSIQEAPFRSCIGGADCSTRTYFSKAFDPNYYYFTMTDKNNHSSGHVTVVLGVVENNGQSLAAAFVDKIQNLPNHLISTFLEVIRQIVLEKGYILVLPENVGDHNGLSNMDTIRHYVEMDILPNLEIQYEKFKPHSHDYNFENKFSRADLEMNVKKYEFIKVASKEQISNGETYSAWFAPLELNKETLIHELLSLKKSQDHADLLRYISSGSVIDSLESLKLYSRQQFNRDLENIIYNKKNPFFIRKQAFLESLISTGASDIEILKNEFHENEIREIASEVRQWVKTNKRPRREFALRINNDLFDSRKYTYLHPSIFTYVRLGFIDPNQKNSRGRTPLMQAISEDHRVMAESLLTMEKVDVSVKDKKGFNAYDYALFFNRYEILKLIEKMRPDFKKEVRTTQELLKIPQSIEFVSVKGGVFRAGINPLALADSKEFAISDFEFMTTPVTQFHWSFLIKNNVSRFKNGSENAILTLPGTAISMRPDNPVEQVSYYDVVSFVKTLNMWAENNNPNIYTIIPDHKPGYIYRLPSSAEWEFVIRNRGAANSIYFFGNSRTELSDYGWYQKNNRSSTEAVGLKKPLLIDQDPNKAVYDLIGNVREWVDNNFVRGGGWADHELSLKSSHIERLDPGTRNGDLGFRLVRVKK